MEPLEALGWGCALAAAALLVVRMLQQWRMACGAAKRRANLLAAYAVLSEVRRAEIRQAQQQARERASRQHQTADGTTWQGYEYEYEPPPAGPQQAIAQLVGEATSPLDELDQP